MPLHITSHPITPSRSIQITSLHFNSQSNKAAEDTAKQYEAKMKVTPPHHTTQFSHHTTLHQHENVFKKQNKTKQNKTKQDNTKEYFVSLNPNPVCTTPSPPIQGPDREAREGDGGVEDAAGPQRQGQAQGREGPRQASVPKTIYYFLLF